MVIDDHLLFHLRSHMYKRKLLCIQISITLRATNSNTVDWKIVGVAVLVVKRIRLQPILLR